MACYSWLIFDVDGTLFDFDVAQDRALRNTFADAGSAFQSHYMDEFAGINSALWRQRELGEISPSRLRTKRFELLFEAIGVHHDAEAFGAQYLLRLAEGDELIDSAEEIVRKLSEDFELAILTNGLTQVQRPRIARSPVRLYVKHVIISEEVGVAKPDARIFDIAFERMGHPPKSEVLFTGDSLTADIQGGNNYGIDTCWFNPKGQPNDSGIEPTYEIRDLQELLPVAGLV